MWRIARMYYQEAETFSWDYGGDQPVNIWSSAEQKGGTTWPNDKQKVKGRTETLRNSAALAVPQLLIEQWLIWDI